LLKLNVSEPKTRLFIGNIPKSKGRDEIEEEFKNLSGKQTDECSIQPDRGLDLAKSGKKVFATFLFFLFLLFLLLLVIQSKTATVTNFSRSKVFNSSQLNISGADVMIAIFFEFCQFSAKKWHFAQKPML
jgi:hypothetical protein